MTNIPLWASKGALPVLTYHPMAGNGLIDMNNSTNVGYA